MATTDARIEALRKVPLLAGLSKRDLARVLAVGKEVEFVRGAVIVEVGDQARDFYLLVMGRARLRVPGRKTELLRPGDYFGEMAALDEGPRTATIVAVTHVKAIRISRRHLLPLLDAYGTIARKILVEMSKRVRAAERSTGRH